MKFVHLGDLHLGKSVNEFSMIQDQEYILKQILDIVKNENVDGVLIAGDVYDRSVPSEEAVRLFNYFLTELNREKKKVFVISGNHDSHVRLEFGSEILKEKEIYIEGEYKGSIPCVDLKDAYGPLHVYLMPYVKASMVSHYFPEKDIHSYEEAFQAVMETCDLCQEERNLILAHQYVAGYEEEPAFAGSEQLTESVGTIDRVSSRWFDAFDYVALGHIHRGQKVGRDTCRYAGAPLKYSLKDREIHSEKSVPVVECREKGQIEVKLLPLKPLREIRHIKGTLKSLMEHAVDRDDYIYATLTDETMQFDAMARLREVYPNTMKLEYDNQETRKLLEEDQIFDTEDQSFQELVYGFYQLMNGKEPEEKEWELIEQAAREAGVIE